MISPSIPIICINVIINLQAFMSYFHVSRKVPGVQVSKKSRMRLEHDLLNGWVNHFKGSK